ncbi:MAG: tRNA uridine-5-carboxymethylaminomethyl(34) synthesis enzyme MnmG [Candidatus Cloacimonetes bacterium]|nr:tRNA uridine-5-carboxymethylaminomethyl(34) synthesis enzyme MnmG [Candidatus Cloacimonadota bacterium]
MEKDHYDVIVIGAGHAGVEAALAAARMGADTLMFVVKYESIGRMSCNPSIGGPAKGHLTREIDALGGEQGRITDLTGIQFRMLNRKKGPAVWAPRAQNDRLQYSVEMLKSCEAQSLLEIKEATIDKILVENGKVTGVESQIGQIYLAPRVILAAGTFMKGTIHIGKTVYSGGRSGEPAANAISDSLRHIGLELARFKTGTPPRVDIRTVDTSVMERQPGDEDAQGFSFYRDIPIRNIADCWLTYTTPETHRIIGNNIKKSALYSGQIVGTGPRYCPSIEDKIVKFAGKDRHQVFIEPEGLHTFEAYVNGISTSLPPQVQKQFIASIPGLENAAIIRYAYAIEYDYVLPHQIRAGLECKNIAGLYLAGQINGTSGYEEAAAQGLVAGINAVLSLDKKEPVLLERSHSYIGVLIDDLITRGTSEPYRMFTSRAEYRLFLRQDNADERLMPLGHSLGLVSEKRWKLYQLTQEIKQRELAKLRKTNSVSTPDIPEPTRLYQLLKRPQLRYEDLPQYGYTIPADVCKDIRNRINVEIKYEGYLKRQLEDIEKFDYLEHKTIPENIDYMSIETIAWEAREKLTKLQPHSLGQASRIAGVNRTDVTALMVFLKKYKWKKERTKPDEQQ